MKRIDCFIPFETDAQVKATVDHLRTQPEVNNIELIDSTKLKATATIREIASKASAPFTLIYTKTTSLSFVLFSMERMLEVAEDSSAAMVYADHFASIGGVMSEYPVIDCQKGALRDDFDFGGVQIYRTSALKEAASRMTEDYEFAGLYDLRLKGSQKGSLVHIKVAIFP